MLLFPKVLSKYLPSYGLLIPDLSSTGLHGNLQPFNLQSNKAQVPEEIGSHDQEQEPSISLLLISRRNGVSVILSQDMHITNYPSSMTDFPANFTPALLYVYMERLLSPLPTIYEIFNEDLLSVS